MKIIKLSLIIFLLINFSQIKSDEKSETLKNKIFDLTLTIKDGMTTFPVPWHPRVEISTQGRMGIEKRETKKITFKDIIRPDEPLKIIITNFILS